jgi:hypothetical protein
MVRKTMSGTGVPRSRQERKWPVQEGMNGTYTGATSSSTMLEQRIKEDSARGAVGGAHAPDHLDVGILL